MKVAEGNVAGSPFARTVFSLAAKRFTGDFILNDGKRDYRWSLENGQVVAATSPSPSDAPGRVALSHGLITSSTLGMVVRNAASNKPEDLLQAIISEGKLNAEQTALLKRHILARNAARVFALPNATFVVDNARSMKADAEVPPLDMRWLIFHGLRTHYNLDRLDAELKAVGERALAIAPAAVPHLSAFEFGPKEQPVIEALQTGPRCIAQLMEACPSVSENVILSVVYALMAVGYLAIGAEVPNPPPRRAREKRQVLPAQPTVSPAAIAAAAAVEPTGPLAKGTIRPDTFAVPSAAIRTPNPDNDAEMSPEAMETVMLIKKTLGLVDNEATHYELLGVASSASQGDIAKSYFALAKRLHPDRLQAIGVRQYQKEAQRLFAAVNKAFSVLSNNKLRKEYKEILAAGGEKAFRQKQREAEEMATKALAAEEQYRIGEMALRRDQFGRAAEAFKSASELAPEEGEYQALYAWASYCNATDKASAASGAVAQMSSALLKAPKSPTARLYHAKLLKLLGRTDEALDSFRAVLKMQPSNREAELEVRLLSKRGS